MPGQRNRWERFRAPLAINDSREINDDRVHRMSSATPMRPDALEALLVGNMYGSERFLRGVAACVDMLKEMDLEESALVWLSDDGPRPVQRNNVLEVLQKIVKRGDHAELVGFTAALTEVCASADDGGNHFRALRGYLRDRGITDKRWEPAGDEA
jgi:hypothetical protein